MWEYIKFWLAAKIAPVLIVLGIIFVILAFCAVVILWEKISFRWKVWRARSKGIKLDCDWIVEATGECAQAVDEGDGIMCSLAPDCQYKTGEI